MPRFNSYSLHLPHLKIDTGRNMRFMFGVRVMRDLVGKFSFFFLPIFLFQLGQQVHWFDRFGWTTLQRGVLLIALFFLVVRVVVLATAIPIGRAMLVLGYQKSLIIGSATQLLTFAMLYYSQVQPLYVLLAMVLEAIQLNFFWNSYHVVLSKSMRVEHVGIDLTTLQFLLQLIAAISPAISGILAVAFGLESLFLIGIIGTLIGLLFAMGLELGHEKDTVSWAEFKSWLGEPAYRKLSISFIGRYFNDVVTFLWPLYVFLILGSVDQVGFLYTLSLFLALVVTFFTGVYLTKENNKRPFFLSGGILSALWFFRTAVFTAWSIALIDMLDKLTSNFHWLYYDLQFMRRGKGSQALSYFVYREMVMSLGAIVFWMLFAAIFLFLPFGWYTLFILAAVGVLFSTLVQDNKLVET